MPESRWMAHARGMVSICDFDVSSRSERAILPRMTNGVQAEDANHFVPLGALVGMPSELFSQRLGQVLHARFHFRCRVFGPGQAAGERGPRVRQRMSAIRFVQHELAYRDRVRRIKGESGYPIGGFEDHLAKGSHSAREGNCS